MASSQTHTAFMHPKPPTPEESTDTFWHVYYSYYIYQIYIYNIYYIYQIYPHLCAYKSFYAFTTPPYCCVSK